ncbi:hypothetical protein RJ640_021476 [Escallonia rubra]|uniref:alpha-mannosidase n=2 Tax=Escallonia rubra TaxID=112253 RepID=A0AA88REZ9_9ASTE|nr:hypothetical protein RJ640_021476 [Escallonia rubra]
MAISRVCFWFLVLCCTVCTESKYMVYNTSQGIVPGKLNVHLVPHTHDDVGWMKTVDQYYVGSNNSIQGACVQNVLDSLVPALLSDKNRKFAFFQRWWRDQSEAVQSTVKQLVTSGQLEFINGGICMHDEAAPHYIDMIDQTTLGHRFIKEEFNVTPRIGWQIDPFGHSAVQAYLLGAEVGFDSLFFSRIDYQERVKRKSERTLEVVWQGSKSLGSSARIFSGIFPDSYEPPDGFYFEVDDESPVVQDNINLFDYNVQERVDDFVAAALSQANITRTNHIMWTMGTDFKYQYAQTWFRNMDKLIHYVNQDGRVNALYSTPTLYTDAKYAADESWPLKINDFFPYAIRPNAYFTGYFTSRPALKGYVRMLSSYYLAARQLEFYSRSMAGPRIDTLADALAIAQHHDAVSGTERQHVADDYAKRLSIGYKEAEESVAASLACMVESASTCPLLNISYCPPTELDLTLGKKLVIVVYNALGWKRVDVVRLPVVSENVTVRDSNGKAIESQILPVANVSIAIRNYYARAYLGVSPSATPKYWLAFTASVPPLGFSTYVVSNSNGTDAAATLVRQSTYMSTNENETIEVGTGNLKLFYSGNEGKLTQFVNNRNLVNASVEQSFSYYSGKDGSGDSQASGAYIFRPNVTYPVNSEGQTALTVFRGPLFDEVHQRFSSWIYQITRVYKEKEHAELEFTVGPIPIDDGIGKEILTQITTTMKSNKTFYTDSNGRDFLERIRDYRADWDLEVNEPVAGNYYPINLGVYMKDDITELSILVDRSVGGSSIVDGQLELMLHRRLLHDDSGGLVFQLNETVCVLNACTGLTIQGKYYLRIDPLGEGAKWRRSLGQEIYSPLLLAFTEQDGNKLTDFEVPTFSGVDPLYSLPDNVAIITLQELEDGDALLRLAHLYEVGEDADLSNIASVELEKLFSVRKISKVSEMSLSANQEREAMEKKRLVWKVEGSHDERPTSPRGGPVDPLKLVVELAPMEIRTFVFFLVATRSAALALRAESKYVFYNTSGSVVHGKLNVHLVPHTHDDVGWKKTIDMYYVGSNNTIQAFFQLWWRDQSEAVKNTIFAGAFPEGYNPPMGFNFEVNDDLYLIVQDDINLRDYNLEERVSDFVAQALSQANITRTNHIMWTMGQDFGYQYAQTWFRNMDKLIHYDGRVNALYSTPSFYTDAKFAAKESWPLKTNDFFPYADNADAYWTGYFTSRPALKRYVRLLSGYYLAARQLEFFRGRGIAGPSTDTLADALAVAQHHDAVSGTEQQHVADDYVERLSTGYKEAEEIVAASLACMLESKSISGCGSPMIKIQQANKNQKMGLYPTCPLLNISYCPPTEVDLSLGKKLVVVVYNSLGWKRVDVIKIPVINENVTVRDSSGKEIKSQLLPVINASIAIRNYYAVAYEGKASQSHVTPKYWLAFTASVPPLGFSTYAVSWTKRAAATLVTPTSYKFGSKNHSIEIGSGNLKLVYSGNEGKLAQYINSKSSIKASVEQSYSYYAGHDGSENSETGGTFQASGAYIFRPNGTYPIYPTRKTPLTVLRGPLYDEVHHRINSWIYQITRVYKEKEHAEVEFTVGPIPIDDGVGKEIITQIKTTMKSNRTFYTDSNGRDFLERIRDYRADWDLEVNQPVAGNYYPVNLGIYMKDNSTELSILVDRSVGGSSIADGQLELMLHRRLLQDDNKGVNEALNEKIQGKYYVRIDPLGEGAKWRRSFGQEIYSPFLLAFTEQDGDKQINFQGPSFSGMEPSYKLPDNIALITIQELKDGKVLLRLAHLYEIAEDKDLSSMASVELKKLFHKRKINKVTEMSLSANQEREHMEKKRLVWEVEGSNDEEPNRLRGGPVDSIKLVVELAPMEIRTFIVDLRYK